MHLVYFASHLPPQRHVPPLRAKLLDLNGARQTVVSNKRAEKVSFDELCGGAGRQIFLPHFWFEYRRSEMEQSSLVVCNIWPLKPLSTLPQSISFSALHEEQYNQVLNYSLEVFLALFFFNYSNAF